MGDRFARNRGRPRLSHIRPGTVLHLADGQWKYGSGHLTLQVTRVRHDLNGFYDDEAWIEGYQLDRAGMPIAFVQALIPYAVLTPPPALGR